MSFLTSLRPAMRSAAPLARRNFSSTPSSKLARLTIVGNLGAEPEDAETPNGQKFVKYVVGTSFGNKENRQTSWFRVASFQPEGPARDFLLSLPKGSQVYVEGDASMRTFDDADGKRQSTLNIVQRKW